MTARWSGGCKSFEDEMIISLAEAKEYLRVDTDFEDTLIETLLKAAIKLCAEVARLQVTVFETKGEVAKTAVLYALGYMYENRAGADYQKLRFTLRLLLFSIREPTFDGSAETEISSNTKLTFAMFDSAGNLVNSSISLPPPSKIFFANSLPKVEIFSSGAMEKSLINFLPSIEATTARA